MSKLTYGNKELTFIVHLQHQILKPQWLLDLQADSVQFYLEPGDGTRYCFVMTRLVQGSSQGWVVCYFDVSYKDLRGAATLWTRSPYEIREAARKISPEQKHTASVIEAFLDEVFNAAS